jgi:beta-carotene 15,15'-dioxygenase
MTSIGLKTNNKLLLSLVGILSALVAIYALEQAWPTLGWWVFVVLTLSLGMGHGALDAVLLLAQFVPKSKALLFSAGYLLLVLLTGWVLSWSLGLALLALIAMSLWHFGELQGDVVSRIAVGGASVMAPMVVAPTQMAALVQPLLAGDQFAAWLAWRWLAIAWVILVSVWLTYWLVRYASQMQTQKQVKTQAHIDWRLSWQHPQVRAALEIACVVGLYVIFSPLLAFALYFGVWHSVNHIAKVQQAMARHYAVSARHYAAAVMGSMVLTLVFLGMLWLFLRSTSLLAQDHSVTVLQWLIVALAALTLPHLLLVSHSCRWLKN